MSQPQHAPVQAPPADVQVGIIHYQIVCAAGLALVFLAQLDQGMMMGNLLVVCVGLLGVVSGIRVAPLLTLGVLLAAQAGNHLLLFRSFELPQQRPWLHLGDLLLAIGMLAFVVGHYRLQALWKHVVPVDPRERRRVAPGRDRPGTFEQALQPRAQKLLTPQEIAWFVIGLPAAALIGQLAWMFLSRAWLPAVYHDRLMRLIVLAWTLVVGLLLVGWMLGTWRRRQMGADEARLLLQDAQWEETRREQRRIFRWLAWRKVREIDQT